MAGVFFCFFIFFLPCFHEVFIVKQQGYPKKSRILKRREFQEIARSYCYFSGHVLTVQWRINSLTYARLGITVTRKWGKSHLRNLFKRYVREVFRRHDVLKGLPLDLNIKPRLGMQQLSIEKVGYDIDQLATNCGTQFKKSLDSKKPSYE